MYQTDLTPIQTLYAGYYMRSRLEARWAKFFDGLQLKWRYEPKSYPCNGTAYLPDFLLTNMALAEADEGEAALWQGQDYDPTRVFLEVKPCGYDVGRDRWHEDFGRRSRIGLLVATGMPPGYTCGRNGGYRHDEAGEVRLFTNTGVWRACRFAQCVYCDALGWFVTTVESRGQCPACQQPLHDTMGEDDVADAAFEARVERFGIDY